MNRDFTVGIGGDVSGLETALNRGLSSIRSFAGTVSTSLGQTFNPRTFASAGQAIGQFAAQAQNAGQMLSIGLSAPLALIGKQALETFGEMDGLRRGLATMEKDAGALTARLAKLNEIAKLPGLGMKETIAGDIRLRTVLNSIYGVEKAAAMSERTMKGFGNAVALVGKGKSEFDRALYGVQQLANTPFPLGEDLNIIKDAIPQVTPLLNAAFGTSRSDDFKKLKISSQQVMETILSGLEKLPKASGGAQNAFENFGDNSKRALDKVGQTLFTSLHVEGFLNAVGDAITKLADKFGGLPSTTQTLVSAFGLLAVALPPLIAGIGFFVTTVLPALRAGMAATRVAMLAMTGPVGLVVLAIAAAATLIIMHWDKIKSALVDSGVWTQLKGIVSTGLGVVTSVVGIFANLFQGDWAAMWEHVKNTFKYAWNGIISLLGAGILAMGGLLGGAMRMVGLDKMADAVSAHMDQVEKTIQSRKFDIAAPSFNLFDGFNFGGGDSAKGKGTSNAGGGKKKKEKEAESRIAFLQRKLSEFEEQIQNFTSLGLTIPDYVLKSYGYFADAVTRAQESLKEFQKTDLGNIKPIDSNNLLGSQKEGDAEAKRRRAFSKALNGDSDTEPALPGLDKFQKSIDAMQKGVKKSADKIRKPFQEVFQQLQEDISNGLRSAAQAGLVGMGELIGGLIAGTASLADLPKMIGSIFANLAKVMGEALIAFGTAGIAAKSFLKNPVSAIIAGVALVALGAALQGMMSKQTKAAGFESGGLFTGESTIRVGETSRARMGGGEFVAPVERGANLIGARILKDLNSLNPAMKSLPSGYSPHAETIFPDYLPKQRIEGQALLLWYERATKSNKAFGNG